MSQFISILAVSAIIGFGFASCKKSSSKPSTSSQNDYFDETWAKDPLWDDGQAEVAIYDAQRIVYGKARKFDYVYIAVKEVFNAEFDVKTDDYDREDLFEVIKVNKFANIPTENYPYHYLTSIFFRRDEPASVHKLTNSSQEWCGLTTKSFLSDDQGYNMDWISYWDGQGNGSAQVAQSQFEDQLSYSLRTLRFEDGLSFSIPLYPSQVTSRATVPDAEIAQVTLKADNALDSLQSVYGDIWKVNISTGKADYINYWFTDAYPNYLLKMEASDGRRLELKKLIRDPYWQHPS